MNNMLSKKQNTVRRKLSDSRGMTMGELLIVVAIIMVLAGVAFIGVIKHQRTLEQLERDNIAKEIFVAAQNHLTMAKGESYLGVDKFGIAGNADADAGKGVYYYTVNGGTTTSGSAVEGNGQGNAADIFNQTLPFGSIDETVRGGGSYIIRYQPKTGTILDVFYCSAAESKFGCQLKDDYYKELMTNYYGEGTKDARKNYTDKSILGWYGGEQPEALGEVTLTPPKLTVKNAETLYVTIRDDNNDNPLLTGKYGIRLIVTGKSTGNQHYIDILRNGTRSTDADYDEATKKYTFVLDDITKDKDDHFSNKHFYAITFDDEGNVQQIPNGNDFNPGEDITLQAVAYTNSSLSNVARSEQKVTNSLFEGIADTTNSKKPDTAYISNIRHLENLDKTVSMLDERDGQGQDDKLAIGMAVQTKNLDWTTFCGAIRGTGTDKTDPVKVSYGQTGAQTGNGTAYDQTEDNCFKPVHFDGMHSYDGKGHSIKDIKVHVPSTRTVASGNVGLFERADGGIIKNLELIDFNVKSEITSENGGNAGTLVGLSGGATVNNVIARNSNDAYETNVKGKNAGGLVGKAIGGTIKYSAASVIVEGTDNAGGLIGKAEEPESANNTRIDRCYSGGHTKDGSYKEWVDAKNQNNEKIHDYDVKATGDSSASGGLVGNAGKSLLINSYSTCSVSGEYLAGGFVGSAEVHTYTDNDNDGNSVQKKSISNCYCTGLVETVKMTNDNTANNADPNSKKGAFAGELTPANNNIELNSCAYLEIINEVTKAATNADPGKFERYLYPVGDVASNPWNIGQIDGNTNSYESYVKAPGTWNPARVYDSKLNEYYKPDNDEGQDSDKAKYPFCTVDQLGEANKAKTNVTVDDYNTDYHKFVVTHYGDWPAPEIFVINQ